MMTAIYVFCVFLYVALAYAVCKFISNANMKRKQKQMIKNGEINVLRPASLYLMIALNNFDVDKNSTTEIYLNVLLDALYELRDQTILTRADVSDYTSEIRSHQLSATEACILINKLPGLHKELESHPKLSDETRSRLKKMPYVVYNRSNLNVYYDSYKKPKV